jgi:hypothetical protein
MNQLSSNSSCSIFVDSLDNKLYSKSTTNPQQIEQMEFELSDKLYRPYNNSKTNPQPSTSPTTCITNPQQIEQLEFQLYCHIKTPRI